MSALNLSKNVDKHNICFRPVHSTFQGPGYQVGKSRAFFERGVPQNNLLVYISPISKTF